MAKKIFTKKFVDDRQPIYDARTLGVGRMSVLGLQHMFAMFGATVLVPIITGLDVSTTLLMAGLGTLLFHLFSQFKVPAFLGSSFAFLGGYATIAPRLADGAPNTELLPYACIGVAAAGCLYLVLAVIFQRIGTKKMLKYFPPIVTGPIIISIGLGLAPTAISSCTTNWWIAIFALAVVINFNIFSKTVLRYFPILLGIVLTYTLCLILGNIAGLEGFAIDFSGVKNAAWIGFPVKWSQTVFGGVRDWSLALTSIIAIMPIALATMMEHIGDISAISATCGKNFIENPGLNRTLLGDGIATILASLFGGPANTTYGENTGVLAITKVYDPRVIRIAAYFAIFLSFCPKFAAIISSMPSALVGGISFILYGMISAIGVRNMVENKVDLARPRNTVIAAVVLVSSLGFTSGVTFAIGSFTIKFSALAIAAILGILLNIVLPNHEEEGEIKGLAKDAKLDEEETK